jgi:thiamine pyrophosphate-dependent acetolactate synthase large subunit-like protein
MKLYQALAHSLADHGIDAMFGVVGEPNLLFVGSFVREQAGTFYSATHEVGATLMAQGYAAVSNTPGGVSVTHGPGVTNTLTGVIDAVKSRRPLVLIYPDDGQNVPQLQFILPTGAGFEQVRSPQTALMDLSVALRRAVHESRPVALNVPQDFFDAEVDYRHTIQMSVSAPGQKIDDSALDLAIGIIASARCPIVIGGRGARSARESLLQLAERIGGPMGTSLGGKDLFHGEIFDLGIIGALSVGATPEIVSEADCIIAFGAGLNQHTTAKGSVLSNKRVVHCDIDPSRLGKHSSVDVGIVGDAGEVANLIVDRLNAAEIEPSSFRSGTMVKKLESGRTLTPAKPDTALDVRIALRQIDQVIPEDKIYVVDPGRHTLASWNQVHVKEAHNFVLTAGFEAIGTGLGIAIGAACADRSRPVLLVTGDGGFMLSGLSEFNSAVRHNLDLIVVVCNDGAYGPEYQVLTENGFPPDVAAFDWPDLAPIADDLGGQGMTVRSYADIAGVAPLIANRTRPVLIDVKLDPVTMPVK